MPEDELPLDVQRGSLEHLLFITLTVAIDYQRDANALWASARQTFADADTKYLFDPALVDSAGRTKVQADLTKYGLSKKPNRDCNIWYTIAVTFHKKWRGDPKIFLAACGWDAVTVLKRLHTGTHLEQGKERLDYPYLRGSKIGPLWLRMLHDNAGLQIQHLDKVPIPVDVHIARASLATGIVMGRYSGGHGEIYESIRQAWAAAVIGLKAGERPMRALDLDEALWHLSKYGCSKGRNLETGNCCKISSCEARNFCIPGKVIIKAGHVTMDT